jgi:hypothetical protein
MVHPSQRENTNERVKHRQRPPIALETALVPIFGEKLIDGFPECAFALLTIKMHPPGLGHAMREQRLRFGQVFCAGALADSLAVNDLVDMPDCTTK